MFRAFAALALASATAHTTPALNPTSSWWERVTVTVNDDGQTQSCRYESSLSSRNDQNCSVSGSQASMAKASTDSSSGPKDEVTRITFERRFSLRASHDLAALQPGETLLGGQVMALAIDGGGSVKNCRVIATSGSVTPQYGCDEATAEHFVANASARQGYMSVLVYGHSEHVV